MSKANEPAFPTTAEQSPSVMTQPERMSERFARLWRLVMEFRAAITAKGKA